MPSIRVRVVLTLARHTIGWNGKKLQRQLRETKAWEEESKKRRNRRQDVDHIYNGCELDDAEMHVKVAKFLDRTMWCHNPRLRDKNDEGLLLKKYDGRGFWPKQNMYDDHVGAARYFPEKSRADRKLRMKCRPNSGSSSPSYIFFI